MNYLLAYPRSGSSWIRYIFEALTGRASTESNEGKDHNLIKRFCKNSPITLDLSKPPILIKFHESSESGRSIRSHKNHYLFLSLRDPKEVIFSYLYSYDRAKANPEKWISEAYKSRRFESQLGKYVSNIRFWLNWKNQKSVICYEDLIMKPTFWINRISQIIGASKESCKSLIENYEYHRDACLGFKSQPGFMRCNTKGLPDGKKIRYWKDLMGNSRIEDLNKRIRNRCSREVLNLLERSLQQYL